MTWLLSIGVSAWNLHAHRYYRIGRSRPMRSWSLGPIRLVMTSYLISPGLPEPGVDEKGRLWRQWLLAGEEGSVQRRRYDSAVVAYAQGASHDEIRRILDGARDPEP